MKNQIVILVCIFLPFIQFSQSSRLSIEEVRELLNEQRGSLENQITPRDRLVSPHTFRELVKKDFSKLTSGTDDNFSTVGKFASLKLDQDKLKFNLTPFTKVLNQENPRGLFRHIFGVDISGSLNTGNRFTWNDRKKLNIGGNYTWVFKENYGFRSKPNQIVYNKIYESLQNQLIRNYYDSNSDIIDSLQFSSIYGDSSSLIKEYLSNVAKNENILTEERRSSKRLWWIKVNANLLSWDFVKYQSQAKIDLGNSPNNKSYYSPSIDGTLNLYLGGEEGYQLYASLGVGFERKNSLSELSETITWNKIGLVNDTINVSKDNQEIHIFNEDELETKILPNYSTQIIGLFKVEKLNFGLELSNSYHSLIKPNTITEDGNSFLFKTLFGVIFPIKDKKGKPSIIIEPFIEREYFKNYLEDSENTVGVKFSIPFTSII